ncbi:hypothetical protein [Rummeliibacillus pycnus]|uniref:hypothetical protein n=1 Tax=Rummeliibacillus pycnus TaxID=101070 RepID=UPI003D2E284C
MPNIDKVIEVFEGIQQAYNTLITIPAVLLWIVIGIYSLVDILKNKKTFSFIGFIGRGTFFFVSLSIVFFLCINIMKADFSLNEKQWKDNYLDPYINSLSENKVDVKDFSQILEMNSNENKKIKSIYLNDKVKPIWMELNLIDKNNSSKKISVQTIIRKEPIENPYLTYKLINKNISDKYRKDIFYETILHIPEEYKVLDPSN